MKIYDIVGKELYTLVDEVKQPGIYRVEFGADILSSGVYFYRLTAGGYAITKRMVIIK